MIADKCLALAWIQAKKQELGANDPGLLEKGIYALALLGHLAESGLDFVFKGGTSLLLHLPRIRRLSIDIDIFCAQPAERLDAVVQQIGRMPPFTGVEESVRGARGLPRRRHFKFAYPSPTLQGRELSILLDVVEETAPTIPLVRLPIQTSFIEVQRRVLVTVPTIEGLLGDKLTAFAPRTTGVPYQLSDGRPGDSMQIVKQLFDVGELFDAAQDLDAAARAYDAVLEKEMAYRAEKNLTREQVLDDTRAACLALTLDGLKGVAANPDATMLRDGARKLRSHLVQSQFEHDDARIAAGKSALLATLLLSGKTPQIDELRYMNTPAMLDAIKAQQIAAGPWDRINRIKQTNPEAFFYWQKAGEFLPP